MANFVFKGIQQVKALPTTPEKGVIYFVREHKDGVATNDMSIYFGSRCYGKVEATRLAKIEADILALDGRVDSIEAALGAWAEEFTGDLKTVAQVVADHEDRIVSANTNAGNAVATANDALAAANEAKNIASSAVTDVTAQVNAANAAKTAAEAAQAKAETAEANAKTAQGAAETAKNEAVAAQGAAETAEANAEAAQSAAEAAKDDAVSAKTDATAAKEAAVVAQGAAEAAKDDAVSAKTDAVNAKTAAETAKADAVAAQTGATAAKEAAVVAQGAAETAQTKAEAAQAAAEAAKAAAEASNTSATAIANEAKSIAGSANTKAESAVATANSAMTYVNKLQIVSGAGTSNTVKEEYKLMVDNEQLGDTIKIYKDSSLKSMTLVDEDGSGKAGQFLKYVYIDNEGGEQTTYVDVSLLLSEAEFGDGLQVDTTGNVSVKIKALSADEQLGGNIQLQKDADGALYGVMYYGGDDTEE